MEWRDWLKDYCGICTLEIRWKEHYDIPDLNYYGRVLETKKPTVYYHAVCCLQLTMAAYGYNS